MEQVAKVQEAEARAAEARAALVSAIRDARAAGAPLREIAAAAKMSHEQVRRLAPRIDL